MGWFVWSLTRSKLSLAMHHDFLPLHLKLHSPSPPISPSLRGLVQVGSHQLNKDSSRSHCIMTLYLPRKDAPGEEGRICFVDLSGSERLMETHTTGARGHANVSPSPTHLNFPSLLPLFASHLSPPSSLLLLPSSYSSVPRPPRSPSPVFPFNSRLPSLLRCSHSTSSRPFPPHPTPPPPVSHSPPIYPPRTLLPLP